MTEENEDDLIPMCRSRWDRERARDVPGDPRFTVALTDRKQLVTEEREDDSAMSVALGQRGQETHRKDG